MGNGAEADGRFLSKVKSWALVRSITRSRSCRYDTRDYSLRQMKPDLSNSPYHEDFPKSLRILEGCAEEAESRLENFVIRPPVGLVLLIPVLDQVNTPASYHE